MQIAFGIRMTKWKYLNPEKIKSFRHFILSAREWARDIVYCRSTAVFWCMGSAWFVDVHFFFLRFCCCSSNFLWIYKCNTEMGNNISSEHLSPGARSRCSCRILMDVKCEGARIDANTHKHTRTGEWLWFGWNWLEFQHLLERVCNNIIAWFTRTVCVFGVRGELLRVGQMRKLKDIKRVGVSTKMYAIENYIVQRPLANCSVMRRHHIACLTSNLRWKYDCSCMTWAWALYIVSTMHRTPI